MLIKLHPARALVSMHPRTGKAGCFLELALLIRSSRLHMRRASAAFTAVTHFYLFLSFRANLRSTRFFFPCLSLHWTLFSHSSPSLCPYFRLALRSSLSVSFPCQPCSPLDASWFSLASILLLLLFSFLRLFYVFLFLDLFFASFVSASLMSSCTVLECHWLLSFDL